MAAEIGDETRQLLIGEIAAELDQLACRSEEEVSTQLVRSQTETSLVLPVAHRVEPGAQVLATSSGKGLVQTMAVLELDYMPTCRFELPAPLRDPNTWHDPVERLAVEVDDPENRTQPSTCRIRDRFPDIALV